MTSSSRLLSDRVQPRACACSTTLHHRLRVPASVAQIHPRVVPTCHAGDLLVSGCQDRVHECWFLQYLALDHRLLGSRINCAIVDQERELGLSPVVLRIIEDPWFPQRSSIHDSLTSHADNHCFRCTLFGLSGCCPHLRNFTLHGDHQLFQRHVVNTTVSATDRSTTDHVVRSTYHHRPRRTVHHSSRRAIHQVTRSHSLHYHVHVDRCDDTFFSSLEMIRTRGLHMRTLNQSVSTRLVSNPQCCTSTQRQVSVSSIVRDSTGSESRYRSTTTSNRAHPRPVACHVPRSLNTNSDPLLHASYCEYRPTTRSTHVATHVIFHKDTAQSEGNPHCPLIQPWDSPCHSLSSPLLKPNRLYPVLGEIERVATNLVLYQHPSRK